MGRRKYATDEERKEARREQQRRYRQKKKEAKLQQEHNEDNYGLTEQNEGENDEDIMKRIEEEELKSAQQRKQLKQQKTKTTKTTKTKAKTTKKTKTTDTSNNKPVNYFDDDVIDEVLYRAVEDDKEAAEEDGEQQTPKEALEVRYKTLKNYHEPGKELSPQQIKRLEALDSMWYWLNAPAGGLNKTEKKGQEKKAIKDYTMFADTPEEMWDAMYKDFCRSVFGYGTDGKYYPRRYFDDDVPREAIKWETPYEPDKEEEEEHNEESDEDEPIIEPKYKPKVIDEDEPDNEHNEESDEDEPEVEPLRVEPRSNILKPPSVVNTSPDTQSFIPSANDSSNSSGFRLEDMTLNIGNKLKRFNRSTSNVNNTSSEITIKPTASGRIEVIESTSNKYLI